MATKFRFKPGVIDRITWFRDSPDAGEPTCICSLCGKLIDEDDVPIRAWPEHDKREVRFHVECFAESIEQIPEDETDDAGLRFHKTDSN